MSLIQPISVGDLFQSEGRSQALWVVDEIIRVPRTGTLARLAQLDGIAKVTLQISQFGCGCGFKRMS